MKILSYRFLVDEMTKEEIDQEKRFLKLHNWTGDLNGGLDFKVLVKSINPIYCSYITDTSIFKVTGGGKGLGKSFLNLQLQLFSLFNFTDVNCSFWKYTKDHAYKLVSEKIFKAIRIFDDNGSKIKKFIDNKTIKINNSQSSSNFKMIFPNKRTFSIAGYDNKESWAGDDDKATGGMFMTYFDEIMSQDSSTKPILDEVSWIKDFIAWSSQILRVQDDTKIFNRELKMFTAYVTFEYNNDAGETIEKTEKIAFTKMPSLSFGFNQHDTAANPHPIRTLYLDNLTIDKNILEKKGYQIIRDRSYADNLGRYVFIGTTSINDNNLSTNLFKLAKHIKKVAPDIYNSIWLGNNMEYSNERYVYRRDLINAGKDLFVEFNDKNAAFDAIVFGGDYADSVRGQDDTAISLLGFKFKDKLVTQIMLVDYLVIHSKDFVNQAEKLKFMAKWIAEQWETRFLKKYPNWYAKIPIIPLVRFGHDSRTVVHQLNEYVKLNVENENFIGIIDREFTTFQGNKWPIIERELLLKQLISNNIFVINSELAKNNSFLEIPLYRDLYYCIKDPKKDRRDETPGINRLDTINSLEYGISLFRGWCV